MFKLVPRLLLGAKLLHRNVYHCYDPHLMTKHLAQLSIKATRRSFLNKTVLNQAKDVIHAEIRKPSDFVLKLKQEGKCPGVIVPYSKKKEDQIDIVLPGKAMKSRMEKPQYRLQRVYVRVEGKDHLCILRGVRMNLKNFIDKVLFEQYVPGQPNYLKVPVEFTHIQETTFFHEGYNINADIDTVDIICYNHEYPTKFYFDVTNVNLDRPYYIGDLANTFPPGVILNPKVNPNKILFSYEMPDGGLGLGDGNTMEDVVASQKAEKEKEKADSQAKALASKEAAAKAEADKSVKGGKTAARSSDRKKK